MRQLWLYFFPLLFVPNFGFSRQTPFGVLEVCDFLIVPFLILLVLAPSARYEQLLSRLHPVLWGFLVWSLLSTLSIPYRYEYMDDVPVLIACGLKLAKTALYAVTGLLIARKLSDSKVREEWLWSLLAALCMLSIGLVATGGDASASPTDALEGYKSYDGITVSVAILCSYISGLWIDRVGSRVWNWCASLVVLFAVCSVILSTGHANGHGRGGWVAFAAGIGYVVWKQKQAAKTVVIVFVLAAAAIVAYEILPNFASLVDMTLSPTDGSSPAGVDDGGRIGTWEHEAPKLVDAPLFGTGFYHRGAVPGLWLTGSHNFFIQMFLETGVVGGILVATFFFGMWRQGGSDEARIGRMSSATRGALIAAIVGGMSGEFYYGGVGALTLFAMLAILGSLPIFTGMNPISAGRTLLARLRFAY